MQQKQTYKNNCGALKANKIQNMYKMRYINVLFKKKLGLLFHQKYF